MMIPEQMENWILYKMIVRGEHRELIQKLSLPSDLLQGLDDVFVLSEVSVNHSPKDGTKHSIEDDVSRV